MKNFFQSKILSSPQETANVLAIDFIRYTEEILKFREKLYIAVSGGSTPNIFFDLLANEYSEAIPWKKLQFFWVDERCVPHNHVESNYGNAFERCFSKVAIPKENLHPVYGGENPVVETVRYTGEILSHVPSIGGYPCFDIIMLGMGEDGHTASIFPGQELLFETHAIVSVSENPISGQKRITLTGKVINNASEIIFVATGHKKKNVLEQILEKQPTATLYPASHISPLRGRLSWYLDKEAAGNRIKI